MHSAPPKTVDRDGMAQTKRVDALPLWKRLLFSLVPLLILLGLCELGLRAAHYQLTGKYSFAVSHAISWVNTIARQKKALTTLESVGVSWDKLQQALYSEEVGAALLAEVKTRYADQFGNLVRETEAVGAELVVVFVPSATDYDRKTAVEFFRGLSEKSGVRFLDLSDAMGRFLPEQAYLLPEDGHPSRFGNWVIADGIGEHLRSRSDFRATHAFAEHPPTLGDLRPHMNEVYLEHSVLVYRMVTNKQGLRMKEDLVFPKEKQRILFLGDSVTFGSYLPNEHTFVGMLQQHFPETEMINAGKFGYTILDEASLFSERAKYIEPDIVVLQVLENDLVGMLSMKLRLFSRKPGDVEPSEEEIAFLNAIKVRNAIPGN